MKFYSKKNILKYFPCVILWQFQCYVTENFLTILSFIQSERYRSNFIIINMNILYSSNIGWKVVFFPMSAWLTWSQIRILVMWYYFWVLYYSLFFDVSTLMSVPCCSYLYDLQYNLRSGIKVSPSLIFLFICLTSHRFLCFQMNFRIIFSGSMMNVIGILVGTLLNMLLLVVLWPFSQY